MAIFEPAFDLVLVHEGGYVNNDKDPGGATKYGISLRFLRKQKSLPADFDKDGDIDVDDIKNLTIKEASYLYKEEFWDKLNLGDIEDQRVANMIFGIAVNAGPMNAIEILQKSINTMFSGSLEVDGDMGPKTEESVNGSLPPNLILIYKLQAISFYKSLVVHNPNLRIFLDGWIRRVNSY